MSSRVRHDPLTGLLTEPAFRRAVSGCVRTGARTSGASSLAVLSIELDRLVDVCGLPGTPAADAAIRAAAERLVGCVRTQDRVARTQAGRFQVLLCPLGTPELAASLADKICQVLRLPFMIEGQRVELSASIGVGLYPRDRQTAAGVIAQAEACMDRAAQEGDAYRFLDATSRCVSPTRTSELADDPGHALREGQFELHYQPRLSLENERVVSAEALIRWLHPVHGYIPPSAFIPVTEATGFIWELGAWILERACTQGAEWQRRNVSTRVSVNVSGRQLEHPEFPELVKRTLDKTGLAPERLELEITESALMRRPGDVTGLLERLRFHGVRTALDDFGTGYSSLAYLQSFPLDLLKIDRSFIHGVPSAIQSGVLLRSIVDLAHALGLRVVAEGVETNAQRAAVKAQGADEIQGFLIAPALPPKEFAQRFLAPEPQARIAHIRG